MTGLAPKGDVSDWLDAGNTVDQLYELVENTEAFDCGCAKDDTSAAPLIRSFGEFMAVQFGAGELIGFELHRREIGLLASVTNIGKSTLLRNALLALACGGEFAPLVSRGIPRNVCLLDFETSASRLQSDLAWMIRGWPDSERQLLNEHFYVVCEGMVDGDVLSLSSHLDVIEREATARQFDLIAVDTTSAAFNLFDENNNAEVTRRALKPLVELARKLDCAIVMAHHIGKGKTEDGNAQDQVHRPRGASAFSGYAASVFLLSAVANDVDGVTLSCAKRKSGAPYEVSLKLDRGTRWFQPQGKVIRTPSSFELVVEVVRKAGVPIKRADIENALTGRVSKATVGRSLAEAISRGYVSKDEHGMYSIGPNAQMLTPIGDEHLSISDVEDDNSFSGYNF